MSFWSIVIQFVATELNLSNVCNPKCCLLGVLEDIDLSSYQKQFLCFLLSYARKMVVLQWIHSTVVPLNQWKILINQVLPIYKLTCGATGCPHKFNNIWGPWIELFDTCATHET